MRLLVCGSRTWTDYRLLRRTVEATVGHHQVEDVTIIEGGARGADRMAGHLTSLHGWGLEVYPARWQQEGRAAGMRRNARMLHHGRPDLVLAFVDKPLDQSRGTADMVRRATQAGVPVQIITTYR